MGIVMARQSRFTRLEHSLARRPGVRNPRALAAWIGRKKYGAHGMAAKSAAGRKAARKRRHK